MENKLNKWFDAAKHNPPMIPIKEVGAMISNPPAVKGRLSTLKKTVFMGTILLIITSWLYWMNIPSPVETKIQNETTQQSKILAGDTLGKLVEPNQSAKQLFIEDESKHQQVRNGSESADYNDAELEYPLNRAAEVIVEDNEQLQFQHNILFLDSKELEVLDIKIEKGSYNYYYKTYPYQNSIRATQLKSVNDSFFFAKGFPGKNYFIKPWEEDFYPLYLTDSLGNDQRNFHFQDKRVSQSWAEFNDSLLHQFRATYQHLIPIGIRTPDQQRLEVLWYKSTKVFIKKLPERYAVLFNEGGYSSNRDFVIEEQNKANDEMISLTNEELAGLGIITNGNTLKYENVIDSVWRSDTWESPTEYKGTFALSVEKHGSKKIVKSRTNDSAFVQASKPFWPAAIQIINEKNDTDLVVVEWMQKTPVFEYPFFYEVKPLLIPVSVSTKGKTLTYSHDLQYIFWFKPEDTFFDALPSVISRELRQSFSHKDVEKYIETARQHQRLNKRMWLNENIDDAKMREIEKRFVTLTDAELQNLNIYRTEKGFELSNNFYANGRVNSVLIRTEGIGKQVIINTKTIKKPKITKRDKPFMPVALTDAGLFSFFTHYLYFLPDSLSNDQQKILSLQKFADSYKELVPIQIEENTVLWFPQTDAFLKALPERIQNKLGVDIANLNRPEITPVKYIELTDEQLIKLGIKRNPASITAPMHTGNGYYLFSDYSSKGSVHNINSFKSLEAPQGGIKFKMNPTGAGETKLLKPEPTKLLYPNAVLITEGDGLHWLAYQVDEEMSKEEQDYMIQHQLSPLNYKPFVEARKRGEAKLVAELNTYIALKVKSNEVHPEGARNPDLIIWYKPDSLFFAALPNELSEQIKQELKELTLKQSGSGCQFFEACQILKGTIQQCTVYPNPATDLLQIKLELGEDRLVSVYLTDISGKKVKDFFQNETQERGEHTYQTKLDGLSEGMYLLHITTDRGEYIVQRVIKKG